MRRMDLNCVLCVNDFECDFTDFSGVDNHLEDMVMDYSEEYIAHYEEGGYAVGASSKRKYNKRFKMAA